MDDQMNEQQYTELTNAIKGLRGEVHKLHGKFVDIDTKMTSIQTWISGDPNIKQSYGTEQKLQRMKDQVELNTKEIARVKRLDALEEMIIDHERKLSKIWTIAGIIMIVASIIGTAFGIFLPPILN